MPVARLTSLAAFAVAAFALAASPAAAHNHAPGHSKAKAGAAAAASEDHAALRAVLASSARTDADRERDAARHPVETLKFWGLRPDMTVVELRPGAGWWTRILAPYLKTGGGTLIATSGDPDRMNEQQKAGMERFFAPFRAAPETYGSVIPGVFTPGTDKPIAPAGTADLVISSRNLHGFALQNMEAYAVKAVFDVLKPGGLFGIEQHRGDARKRQNPASGYMRQDMVIAQMRRAGFEFVGASEINANPADTKDHPFGVWTLPPTLQTAPQGQPANPDFDNAKFKAIGESDRMTLLFRKPTA